MGSRFRFRRGIIPLLLFFSPLTLASPPSWTGRAFWEDSDYYYYVGVATNAPSEEEGRIQAHERALAEAIQHLFGIQTTMSRRAFISDDNLVVDEDLSVQLPKSFLVGVKVVNQHVERGPNGINVWRVISVPKNKSLLFNDDTPKIFNRYNSNIGNNSIGRGKLRVKTEPINSQIFLNDEPIGKSNGEFENVGAGKYRLRAEKGGYGSISREILISQDSTTEISLLLKPQLVPIEIKTTPEGATVYNGESLLGQTPLSTSLTPNTYRLRIEKEHFEPTILHINATEEDNRSHSLALIPLPGKLLIQTSPIGGTVYSSSGKLLGTTPLFLEKYPAGKHQFIFELKGFPLSAQTIEVKSEESTELHHSFDNIVDENNSTGKEKRESHNPIIFGRGDIPLDSAPSSMNPLKADKQLIKINKRLALENLVEEVAKSRFRETKINGSRLLFWNYVKEKAVFLPPSYTVKKDKYYLTTYTKIDLSPLVK
ncbi:MAG: hypothetical protein A3F16_03345 [Deltaproteobacteria bacterium RIFCSPHIGHO2_12_FULL_43_9]|nr:MAG: hypothetical protein A3F16_03345 [Deltaproteobacteria bacterium RIFCSPHIGHO2_12_FULL_43_9]